MSETTAVSTPDATDTGLQSSPLKPDYGRNATFENRGFDQYDNRALAAMFQTIFDDCQRYRQPFEGEWIKAYGQYHGSTDIAGKAPWQSKVHVPMSKRDVDTIAARLVSVVFSEQDWFGIEPSTHSRAKLADIAKKVIQDKFNVGRFRTPIETAFKDALICGNGPMKVSYERASRPAMSAQFIQGTPGDSFGLSQPRPGKFEMRRAMKSVNRLRFEPIIPTDFWLDPSGQGRFEIHRSKRHISDLWKLAKPQVDQAGKESMPAIYDPIEVAKVKPGARDRQLDNYASAIRRDKAMGYGDLTVDVYEFWGDFIDPSNGAVIFQNCVATFVDKQWCVRKPGENPLWHQGSPFLLCRPMLNPHQIYGYGFLMQSAGIQDEMDRVLQVMIDKMHMTMSMVEADTNACKNPEDLAAGQLKVEPGKIWQKKSGDRKIFTAVEGFTGPTEWDAQVYRLLQEAFGIDTNVSEFDTGERGSSTRKTKAEVEIKVSASQQAFNAVGQYVEENFLSPLVKMVYELAIQFESGFMSPRLLRMFDGDAEAQKILYALSSMPLPERWSNMELDGEFRVTGVTLQISRQQRLDRLMNFVKAIGGFPQLAAIINFRTLLGKLLVNFDLEQDMVIGTGDAMLQAAEQMVIQQFTDAMAQIQGRPGAGGAPGQAPNPNNDRVSAQASSREGVEGAAAEGQPPQ